ncbi:MAG: hypothetical protein ACLFRR_10975, partial [Spirochaetaceae bacterium]
EAAAEVEAPDSGRRQAVFRCVPAKDALQLKKSPWIQVSRIRREGPVDRLNAGGRARTGLSLGKKGVRICSTLTRRVI